jgi:hypothetical protein
VSVRPTVVLLHGLGRTRWSLARLRRYLERQGFATWARSYPSRRLPLAAIADEVAGWILRDLPGGRPLAAVTHSLGGIIVRHIGRRVPFDRVVMLAPPNQGSRVARALGRRPLYRRFLGPAGQALASPEEVATWPEVVAPCAVIAGVHAHPLWNPYGWIVRRGGGPGHDEPNDGLLAVSETRMPGLAAFATVHATHTFIMRNRRVREMAVRFLDGGTLDP